MKPRFQDARKIGRRVLVDGELCLTSPCHLGGPDPDATSERPVLRDATGHPYLPGTTLAGLLRGALDALEPKEGEALFGGACGDDNGVQSPLIVDDAPVTALGSATELRDGVKIKEATGIADDQKKFDIELLPVGTRFNLHFELVLPGDEGDAAMLELFTRLLAWLERGEVQLGARTTRGLGACEVPAGPSRWKVRKFDTSGREGLLAWLGEGRALGQDWPAIAHTPCPSAREVATALKCSLPDVGQDDVFRVHLTLEIAGSLLIRSGGHDPDEADAIHLHRIEQSEGDRATRRPVLTGTSLAGVLRHRCLRIAQTLEGKGDRAAKLVNGMFGELSRASRVQVPEAPVTGGKLLRHTRLRIDPWTGGALESFLFTEDAYYGGKVDLTIALRRSDGAERALLLLALRDLATGDLSVGGESGVGRGRLRPPEGNVFAQTTGPAARPNARLTLLEDGRVEVSPPDAFATDFQALRGKLGSEGT